MMNRSGASPTTRDLAERLLAYEAAVDRTLQPEISDTCHVCEKLRHSLERLFGPAAYSSLVARALALAKLEAPILNSVQVTEDGSINGLMGEAVTANNILIAHLIGLMETIIGEPVTLWILNDLWPTLPGSRMTVERRSELRSDGKRHTAIESDVG